MTGRDTWRLVGTAVLTIATAVPYAAGIWASWVYLFSRLPMMLGLLPLLGIVIAPIQLVRDVLAADRSDQKTRPEIEPDTE